MDEQLSASVSTCEEEVLVWAQLNISITQIIQRQDLWVKERESKLDDFYPCMRCEKWRNQTMSLHWFGFTAVRVRDRKVVPFISEFIGSPFSNCSRGSFVTARTVWYSKREVIWWHNLNSSSFNTCPVSRHALNRSCWFLTFSLIHPITVPQWERRYSGFRGQLTQRLTE